MDRSVESKVVEHKHNGLDCSRVNSCDIEYSDGRRSGRLSEVIKGIFEELKGFVRVDGLVVGKLGVVGKGKFLVVGEDGFGVSKFDVGDISLAGHRHSEYVVNSGLSGLDGEILVKRGGGVVCSGVSVDDVVRRDEIDGKEDRIRFKDVGRVLVSGDDGVVCSSISIDDVAVSRHNHNDMYIRKMKDGIDGGVVVKEGDGVVCSGVRVDDVEDVVIFVKDNLKRLKDGYIIYFKDGYLVSSDVRFDEVGLKVHRHNIGDINGIGLLLKDEDVRKIVREEVKKMLESIFKGV